jgi:HK97 family phage prohead protease
MERRVLNAQEVRAAKNGDKMTVRGYAATYGTLSKPLPAGNGGSFRERIAKGAFQRILTDVVALFNHDTNAVLGRTVSGTLRLTEDDNGLAFEYDLPNTTAGRDVWESVKRGDLRSCSFAFQLGDRSMEDWEEEELEKEEEHGLRGKVKRAVKCIVRTIRDFSQLFDVSIVTDPAYPGTSIDARSLAACEEFRSRRVAKPETDEELVERGLRICEKWYEEAQADKKRRNKLNNLILDL